MVVDVGVSVVVGGVADAAVVVVVVVVAADVEVVAVVVVVSSCPLLCISCALLLDVGVLLNCFDC